MVSSFVVLVGEDDVVVEVDTELPVNRELSLKANRSKSFGL